MPSNYVSEMVSRRKHRHIYQLGPYRLDLTQYGLFRNGKRLPIRPRAFDVLCTLAEKGGHLVKKEELIEAVWQGAVVQEAGLTQCIYELRKTLSKHSSNRPIIQTIPKRGYCLLAKKLRRVADRDGLRNQTRASRRPAIVGEAAALRDSGRRPARHG